MNKVHLIGYRNNYFLVYELFEFAIEWIPTNRNNAEIIFSSKNHLPYCNCWQEDNKRIPHLSLLFKLNSFVTLALFSPGIHKRKERKLTSNWMWIKRFFKDVIYLFCCQEYLKHFLKNNRFRQKSGNDACSGNGESCYLLRNYDALRTEIDMWLTP